MSTNNNFKIDDYENLTINTVRSIAREDSLHAKLQRDVKVFQDAVQQGVSPQKPQTTER